ncbi:ABC transporter substrate-binding protein [Chenggangzhangella methanolivorans]|uniref:ABC transporter substrate-binding protein n=1 Tax=Chenggangzhangella methanolivorans TaxID=1437009 RepID=UPI003608D92D
MAMKLNRKLWAVTVVGALIGADPATATEYNTSSYDAVAQQAKRASGDPVSISTNLFVGWTGAWDTILMKQLNLWQKWLPEGSKVEWKRNLQGPPVITDLLANKQQIGYLGDNPAVLSTTKSAIAPVYLVGMNAVSPSRMCGVLLVRKGAPHFATTDEAVKWLDGKTVGVPKGSCADRLAQGVTKKAGVKPVWQQMQAEVIVTSLQAGRIDAAAVYEPHATKAVFDGYADFAASSADLGESDANAILMRGDFIDKNRAVAVAWLKANIEALYYLRDKPKEAIEALKAELPDYTREELWHSIYGNPPEKLKPAPVAFKAMMTVTSQERELVGRIYEFLKSLKVVQAPSLSDNAIRTDLVEQAFKELNLDPTKGLFELTAKAAEDCPYKGDQLVSGG